MIKPQDIHPLAIAGLSVVTGSSSAGLLAELDNYDYQQDNSSVHQFHYTMPNDESSALIFTDELTEVVILGRNSENIENLNFILTRAGWTSAVVHSVDQDAEELVLQFITLQVTDVQRQWADERTRTEMTASIASSVETAAEATSELSAALVKLDQAKETVVTLEAEKRHLEGVVNELTVRLNTLESTAGQGASYSTILDDAAIREILIEKLLQECRQHIKKSNHASLFEALMSKGYGLHIRQT